MNRTAYSEFMDGLKPYYDLYNKGLKKKANQYIDDFVRKLSELDIKSLSSVLYLFSEELCDGGKYEKYTRGNGRIPYSLDNLLRNYLYAQAMENKMPQLRWYYQLYKHDRVGHQYAFDMLKKAYAHDKCDKQTVDLLFAAYIEKLAWAAHHFPEGCIMERVEVASTINECKSIMNTGMVEERLLDDFEYFKKLYTCYYKYVDEGRTKDFDTYCAKEGIAFDESKVFYYI